MPTNTSADIFTKALNAIALLVAFSSLFYFAGLIYEASYAFALGIPGQFLETDYNLTLIRGAIGFLPLLPLILYCLGVIYPRWR